MFGPWQLDIADQEQGREDHDGTHPKANVGGVDHAQDLGPDDDPEEAPEPEAPATSRRRASCHESHTTAALIKTEKTR